MPRPRLSELTFDESGKLHLSLRGHRNGQSDFQSAFAISPGDCVMTAPAEKSRHAIPFERLTIGWRRGLAGQGKHLQNPAGQRGQPSQVHAIVAKDALQPVGSPADVIKIDSGNERGIDIFAPRPAQRLGAQHALFEMAKLYAADLQLPDFARGMKEIEMRFEDGNLNRPGHLKSAYQQRPIEAFAVEGDQHGTLPKASRKLEQDGIFLGGIAHKKLFDLNAAGIPPGQADQEGQIPRASDESGGFGIQEEPFLRIAGMIGAKLQACGSRAKEKLDGLRLWFVHGGSCIPLARRDVVPEAISRDLGAYHRPTGISWYPRIRQGFALPSETGLGLEEWRHVEAKQPWLFFA